MINWDELEKIVNNCGRCELCRGRHNVVLGTGNRNSKIMFVGEGPGYHEDMRGEPFVGPAGQLLDKMLASIGLNRQEVYIANVVKCRPPGNRDPLPEERETCLNYLRIQYLLINPKIIVCLGRIAAISLITPNFSITRDRGKWFYKKGVQFTATYHPSALLRDESKKRLAWEDLKAIKEKLNELENN
ncbi:MAG: uracil-DNA glycosylase [Clostridiales bacterium]|nr:uracil-DNA glycosylase [Clostridiales bacterium]